MWLVLRLRGEVALVVVAPHKLVEALPQSGDGLIFPCHPEDLLEFAVEVVAGRQQLLKALRSI